MSNRNIVVITGAGISAESGISTFRDVNGLWRNYRIEEVASPEAWQRDPALVLEFYNMRRRQLFEVEPNEAHRALVRLEKHYPVHIVTQNVDDLHERAGSGHVLHLHGELKKARSTRNPNLVYELKHWELNPGDKCELGSQLRPHIVWFGEAVPAIGEAAERVAEAGILLVIGTSLQVYPAAGLLAYAPAGCRKWLIDPAASPAYRVENLTIIRKKAAEGVPEVVNLLIDEAAGGSCR